MKRFFQIYTALVWWLIVFIFEAGVTVASALNGGFDNEAPWLSCLGAATSIFGLFGLVFWGAVVFLDLSDSNWHIDKWRRTAPYRVRAREDKGQILIERYGGGEIKSVLGRFEHDEAEEAIECMADAKELYMNIASQKTKEARRIVGILNG